MNLKKIIRSAIPLNIILPIFNFVVCVGWFFRGIRVSYTRGLFRLMRGKRELRLSSLHSIYLQDALRNFDFYFDGVVPAVSRGIEIVDYSMPRWHDVKGFDLFPIYFNALSEPLVTTKQYIETADITDDCVAIDLGAYSALTSIMIDMEIKSGGLVIAVEADKNNFISCEKNVLLYEKVMHRKIELVNAAAWDHTNGIVFSSEGTMGSSATDIIGNDRGDSIMVKTVTLASLVEQFQLKRVDFIKCDIEGAEAVVFNSPEFFSRFKPRIIIECHIVNGISTEYRCKELLKGFGYSCEVRKQHGYPLPLLFCTPNVTNSTAL